MSYIFPRRVLRNGDVMDNVELTEDITPAADRVSGKLNMHNFDATMASSVVADPEAFYAIHHYDKYAQIVWSAFAGPQWYYPDGGTNTDMALVQNNFEWQPIFDANGQSTELTMTTGQSVLWINGYVQYVWWGFNPTPGSLSVSSPPSAYAQHVNEAQTVPVNLQFALRVNGNIIPQTVTGIDDLTYRTSLPLKPTSQRLAGGASSNILPGPQDVRGNQVCALGPPCLPIRVGACVPCVPGFQRVELVVRRAPYVTDTGVVQYGSYDKIYCYSRQLNVVELKSFPIDSVGPAEVTAPAFEPEEPLTTLTLYGNRVQPVVNAYNDVQEGSLARGALMHYHLPQSLIATPQGAEFANTSWLFNCYYPGGTAPAINTVTLNNYMGMQATGWALLRGNFRVQNVPVSTSRKLLVLANVQVRNIQGRDDADLSTRASSIASFALFQIMYQNNTDGPTTWLSVPESMGMVNNFVWWPKDPPNVASRVTAGTNPAYGVEHVEIQLMALLDFTTPQATPINIGVFGSVANTSDECEVIRGSLYVMPLRA
jgi:hypothetical protein